MAQTALDSFIKKAEGTFFVDMFTDGELTAALNEIKRLRKIIELPSASMSKSNGYGGLERWIMIDSGHAAPKVDVES